MIEIIISTLTISLIMFLLGMFVGSILKKPKFKKNKIHQFLLHKKRQKFIKQWDGMYVHYEKLRKIIESSFTQEFNKQCHYTISNKLIWEFNKKFWRETSCVGSSEFMDVYYEKRAVARDLFTKLKEMHTDHFSDQNAINEAKGKWLQKIREERLGELIDK